MKKVGILTSGGDAPGMNAAISAATKALLAYGYTVYGVKFGYKGIIEKNFVKLELSDVAGIVGKSGTILKSARLPEFSQIEVQKQAVQNLKDMGIEHLIVIGGDGSFKGAQALSRLGINCIALPGTIDNDMSYTDFTIGYLTACQTAMDATDKISDTMESHERLAVVEVMGRYCGDIAIRTAISTGADYVATHETGVDIDKICKAALNAKVNKKGHCLIVLTEGMMDVHELASIVEERTGWNSRGMILGHIQRGGAPVAEDRVIASVLGATASEQIHNNESDKAIGIRDNQIVVFDIEEALNVPKQELTKFFEIFKKIA